MALNQSSYGRPRNIALQEKAVEDAQRKLNRIERMREEMAKQVQLEMKRLEDMRQQANDLTKANEDALTQPNLSKSTQESFESQFEQFNTTPSIDKLKQGGTGIDIRLPILPTGKAADNRNAGIGNGENNPLEADGKPLDNVSFYRTSDQDQHFTTLTADPGTAVYVSGYYYSSGQDSKRYEYQLGSTQLPLSVGDMVQAPVHSQGHLDGKFMKGHDRRFIVTDIYTKEKFKPYHDILW